MKSCRSGGFRLSKPWRRFGRLSSEVFDDDGLYRRIAPSFLKPDGSVASAAFKTNGKPDDQISVDLARMTTPQRCAERAMRPGFAVGELIAGECRSLGFAVRHDPLGENDA